MSFKKLDVVQDGVVLFSKLLRVLKDLSNESTAFLYNYNKEFTYCSNDKLLITPEKLLEFLKKVTSSCHSLRDKSFLYFLLCYLLYRLETYKSISLYSVLSLEYLFEEDDTFKKYLLSYKDAKYIGVLTRNYESLRTNFNNLLCDYSSRELLDELEFYLNKIKHLTDLIEKTSKELYR